MERKEEDLAPEAISSVGRTCDILGAFRQPGEILELREIATRAALNKPTTCRILKTLTAKRLIERIGTHGYRSLLRPLETSKLRIGYAAQSTVVPFISTVTESLVIAARTAGIDLIVLNNKASRTAAVRNAERLIREKVDLAIEFQIIWDLAGALAAKFSQAGIPVIAVDVPQPNAIYFGADDYRAGLIAGKYLGRWASQRWNGLADQVILLGEKLAGPIVETRLNGILDGLLAVVPAARSATLFRYGAKSGFAYGLQTMRKHVREHQAGRVLVGAINDMTALGALEAFRELGLEDHCAIVGQDGVIEARAELRRPHSRFIATVAYFPETYGERLVNLAQTMLGRKPVPPAVFTDHKLLTPKTVDKVYPHDFWMHASRDPG